MQVTGVFYIGIPPFNCASQILYFTQIEAWCQPCIKEVYWCHFSNRISHFVSVCHLLVFLLVFQICYGDLQSVIFDIVTTDG